MEGVCVCVCVCVCEGGGGGSYAFVIYDSHEHRVLVCVKSCGMLLIETQAFNLNPAIGWAEMYHMHLVHKVVFTHGFLRQLCVERLKHEPT